MVRVNYLLLVIILFNTQILLSTHALADTSKEGLWHIAKVGGPYYPHQLDELIAHQDRTENQITISELYLRGLLSPYYLSKLNVDHWLSLDSLASTVPGAIQLLSEYRKTPLSFEQIQALHHGVSGSSDAARFNKALIVKYGYGVNQSEDLALEELTYLADQNGYAPAQYELGVWHFRKGDYDRAITYLHDAAHQRLAKADYSLGKLYTEGLVVKRDFLRGRHYLKAAALQFHVQASMQYAETSLERNTEKYSPEKAANYFSNAVAFNYEPAIEPLVKLWGEDFMTPHQDQVISTNLISSAIEGVQSAKVALTKKFAPKFIPPYDRHRKDLFRVKTLATYLRSQLTLLTDPHEKRLRHDLKQLIEDLTYLEASSDFVKFMIGGIRPKSRAFAEVLNQDNVYVQRFQFKSLFYISIGDENIRATKTILNFFKEYESYAATVPHFSNYFREGLRIGKDMDPFAVGANPFTKMPYEDAKKHVIKAVLIGLEKLIKWDIQSRSIDLGEEALFSAGFDAIARRKVQFEPVAASVSEGKEE